MNKQELIEKYELELKDVQLKFGANYKTKVYEDLIEDLKQLDEPQKVTIPQFVADWIDNMKCQGKTLYYGLDHTPPEEVDLWFCEDEVNRQNTFARAWLDGYEVDKENRYRVKMKGMDKDFTMLKLDEIKGGWYLGSDTEFSYTKNTHTRKELEDAGFGEVFNSPLFEVEEVEG